MTRIFKVDPQQPDPEKITEAGRVIRDGGLVAFPTETVYGLGANALDSSAVARIFEAKERPKNDPIIVHIAELSTLKEITTDLPDEAYMLARQFWPGPLTLVVQRNNHIPDEITAGLDSVAVRMPAHTVALQLIKAAGVPIGAPSANRFSTPSSTTAQHVLADLEDRVDIILDAGPTSIGVESTVLSLLEGKPTILRPGGVTFEDLQQVITDVIVAAHYRAGNDPVQSPGTLTKHYSPNAPVMLYKGDLERVISRMKSDADDLLREGKSVGVIVREPELTRLNDKRIHLCSIGEDLEEIAHNLFARLRELDALEVDIIMAYMPEHSGLGLAIRDRLTRAAEGRIIEVE